MFSAKPLSSVGHESMPGVLPHSTLHALTLTVLEAGTDRHEDLFSVGLKSVAENSLFNFVLGIG